ncbi:hypothetical protein ACT4UM_04930 [Bacillus sp. SS-TM]
MQMKLKDIPEIDEIRSMAQLAEEQWGVNTDEWLTIVLEKYKQGELSNYITHNLQTCKPSVM